MQTTEDSYYSHVESKKLRKFLEINSLKTVFDFEEYKTEFRHIYFRNNFQEKVILFEYDSQVTESVSEQISKVKFRYDERTYDSDFIKMQDKMKKWPFRTRLTIYD